MPHPTSPAPSGPRIRGLLVSTEIYRHALADLGITAAEAVFIDNSEPNVLAAEALGITAHLFTDATALRAFLVSLG